MISAKKKYEDKVKNLNTKLIEQQKQLANLKKKADEAKHALLQAKLSEKTTIQGAESLFTNSVKTLDKNGVSVRKSSCSEYRQMNEFRNLVEKIDTKYKFTDVYTPVQVNNVCSTKTCQHSEGYHMGKPVTCGGFLPKYDFSSIVIDSSSDECCTNMKWQTNKLAQCYVDAKNYSNDILGNPVFNNRVFGKLTLQDCKAKCLNPSTKDPKGRPCVAVEFHSTSTNPKQQANCSLLWGCDYTKPWIGGNVFKLIEPCSAADYLTFNGKRQKPAKVHAGVVDTSNCQSGFRFDGKGNSIVQYNSFNIAGSSRMTFMAWVKLDNFKQDVGLFSYGSYQEQCGFMAQLRVRGGKDIQVRASSKKAKSFGAYYSNGNVFKNHHIKTWMHVAIVKDVKKILFYVNGKPVGSKNFTDVLSKCKNQFQLGRWIEKGLKVVDGLVKVEKGLKVVDGRVKDIRVFTDAKNQTYVREAYEKRN